MSNKDDAAKGQNWWRGAVIYQVYPRSFKDSNGDGVGDLNGIAAQADYIAALGVDAVWLSPFFKSPMVDYGYDVEDYCAVDPLFGTLADFDAMLTALHKRGVKLVIDLVLSHTSDKHPWFRESCKDRTNPKADWYVWADPKPDGTPPNNWLGVFGGSAWKFHSGRGQYYYHQFFDQQPDLNVRNPEVQEALLAAAKFWLERGVDGFRLDAVNHCIHDAQLRDNPPAPKSYDRVPDRDFPHTYEMQLHIHDKSQPENLDFLRRLRRLTDQYQNRVTIAEVGDEDNIGRCIEYTAPGLLHAAYSFSLLTEQYGAGVVRKMVSDFHDRAKGASWPTWAFSNHDAKRVATRWSSAGRGSENQSQVKMLQALLTSLWGTVFVYQGEELGLPDVKVPFEKMKDPFGLYVYPADVGRDGCRTPMPWEKDKPYAGFSTAEPWLPVGETHLPLAVDQQARDAASPLAFFRHFIQWRKTHPALVTGDIAFLDAPEPILAFRRDNILAIFNMGHTAQTYTLPAGVTPLDGHGLPYTLDGARLSLPPFGGFFGESA